MIRIIDSGGGGAHGGDVPALKSTSGATGTEGAAIPGNEGVGGFGQQLLVELMQIGSRAAESEDLPLEAEDYEQVPTCGSDLDGGPCIVADPEAIPRANLSQTTEGQQNRIPLTRRSSPSLLQRVQVPAVDQGKQSEKPSSPMPRSRERSAVVGRKLKSASDSEPQTPISVTAPANQSLQAAGLKLLELPSCRPSERTNPGQQQICLPQATMIQGTEQAQGSSEMSVLTARAESPVRGLRPEYTAQSTEKTRSIHAEPVDRTMQRVAQASAGTFFKLAPQYERGIEEQSELTTTPFDETKPVTSELPNASLSEPGLPRRKRLEVMEEMGRERAWHFDPAAVTTAPHSSPHVTLATGILTETIRDGRELSMRGGAGPQEQSTRVLDFPVKHPEQQWTQAGTHFAEAGFHDASLGWISVRAARDPEGLHAIIVPPSAEAARMLSAHLGGLNAHLGASQIPVGAVTLSSFEDAQHTAAFGGDAQRQHNGDRGTDQRDEGRPPVITQVLSEGSSSSSGSSVSERDESVMLRSGGMLFGKTTRISLVA